MTHNSLVETSVGVRLSDNLLNHAQIVYRMGPEPPRAEQHRAHCTAELDSELAAAISSSRLREAGISASLVPRLLVLGCDDPTFEGLRRALIEPRLPLSGGVVMMPMGRAMLRLQADDLQLVWRACEALHAAHYADYWSSREPSLLKLAAEADERLAYAEIPDKLAHLSGREPPHANIEVHLLDSPALVSFAAGGDRTCMTAAVLSRFERFVYLFAQECARIYLHNPPWWEVEPCAGLCTGLSAELLDAVEDCLAQYLAATLALNYGRDPGFWMVHPQVEDAVARHWPEFVASPEKGVDLLLEQVLERLRGADLRGASVHPLRPWVSYDEAGYPSGCRLSGSRF